MGNNPSEHSHTQWMEQIAAGDKAAFEKLYDHFSPRVYGLVLKMTGSSTESEDLIQEIFLQVWSRAKEYQPERGSVSTWILRIARNRTIDFLRSRGRRATELALKDDDQRPTDRLDPVYDDASSNLLTGWVKKAMISMPPAQQEVLDHAYFKGLTHQEIADRLQIPVGTVKSRLHRGLQYLRTELASLRRSSKWKTYRKGGATGGLQRNTGND